MITKLCDLIPRVNQEYLNVKIKEHNRSLNKIILGSGYPESVYDIMR